MRVSVFNEISRVVENVYDGGAHWFLRMLSFRAALVLTTLQVVLPLAAASLKPETKAGWEEYLRTANAAMQARLQPNAHFLWVEEEPGRLEETRTKGPHIAPAGSNIPMRVPNGLVHHWLGAAFIPNVKVEDVLAILRNYDRYKDIYKPAVIGSAYRGTVGLKDRFSLRLGYRSMVAKTALDTECEASYVRVDDRRWYSVTNATRIIELAKFGTPEQHALPEDEGIGLIWRLSTITRLEERDGGVYMELEVIALSRDIPTGLRPFFMPIVRRVSRDSLATSLRQTRAAVENGKSAKTDR
jgi:hypothetical protein